MVFNIKQYKYIKSSKNFKKLPFFILYNTTNYKNFIKTNQQIKKLNLNYHTLFNSQTKVFFETSVFKQLKTLINGLILILQPINNEAGFDYKKIKALPKPVKLISVKMYNKIILLPNKKTEYQLNYKHDQLLLVNLLKTYLKYPNKIQK